MLRTLISTTLFAAYAYAQTQTDCQPLDKSCPSDAALGTTYSAQFNSSSMTALDDSLWNVTAGSSLMKFTNDGVQLSLSKSGQSVTFKTKFYIQFGVTEVVFKAAAGNGIVSSAILLSDDLDEIDWEILGASNNNVSTNWFGHGNQSQNNGDYPSLANPSNDFHSYKIDWNKDRLQWILDGNVVRTVPYADSGMYPQTPSFLSISLWAPGDVANNQPGVVAWGGGAVDYSKGPYTMTIKSVTVTDGSSNTTSYSYGDRSGNYQSIKSVTGQSAAYNYINKQSSTQQAITHWNGLSTGAKIGIAVGVIGTLVILFAIFCVYCMLQRKKGRAEKAVADKEWQAHEAELMQYRKRMGKGGFARMDNRF